MKENRYLHKAKTYFWVLLIGAYSVATAGVVIDVLDGGEARQLSKVAVTSVQSPAEVRMSGAAQVAAVYRARSGAPFSSLPPGSTFKVVWPDGSSEYVQVVSAASGGGVQPVPGTQSAAPGEAAAGTAAQPQQQ